MVKADKKGNPLQYIDLCWQVLMANGWENMPHPVNALMLDPSVRTHDFQHTWRMSCYGQHQDDGLSHGF